MEAKERARMEVKAFQQGNGEATIQDSCKGNGASGALERTKEDLEKKGKAKVMR